MDLGLLLGQNSGLLGLNAGLALLEGEGALVVPLLLDLLLALLARAGVGADGSMGLGVPGACEREEWRRGSELA